MKTLPITNQSEIEAVISKCSTCYIGLADTDGVPYVFPMNFGFCNSIIYFHSAQTGRSISILKRNPRICVTFCTEPELICQDSKVACSYRMRNQSVICWGNVIFEEDFNRKVEALNIIMEHYSDQKFEYSIPSVNNVCIWKIKPDIITGKAFGVPYK